MFKRFLWLGMAVCFFALGKNYLADRAKLQDLREKNLALETKVTQLKEAITNLRSEDDRLTNDPEYIERRARSKLKMSKEGEVVISIDRP